MEVFFIFWQILSILDVFKFYWQIIQKTSFVCAKIIFEKIHLTTHQQKPVHNASVFQSNFFAHDEKTQSFVLVLVAIPNRTK